MPRKKRKPTSSARLAESAKPRKMLLLRPPAALRRVVDEAIKRESRLLGHTVTLNEWYARAAIDRIGEVFGTSVAKELYRNFFNGLAAIELPVSIPKCDDAKTSGQS